MVNLKNENKKSFLFIMICTLLFGLVAHGYCYFNVNYSHDSLLIYQNDFGWQISLGRFLHPVYLWGRGLFYTPTLVGFLSLLFIGVVCYLITQIFSIKNKTLICLICGVLVTNMSVTLLTATYILDVDIYMFSLLLSVLSVYVLKKFKYGLFLSPFLLICSLGLYQSYFQVAIFLFMMIAVKDILDGKKFKDVFVDGVKEIVILLVSLIFYYLLFKWVLVLTNIEISNSSNGLSTVGQYNNFFEIYNNIITACKYVFKWGVNPKIYHSNLIFSVNILMFIVSVFIIFYILFSNKVKFKNILLLLIILILMPFGINFVGFISHGVEHELMIYSFYLFYVFVIMLLQMFINYIKNKNTIFNKKSVSKCSSFIVCALFGILIFNSIIYSNQVYLKKDFEYQTTLFTMTRIVDRIEETDGYVVGETPVVFVGNIQDSKLYKERLSFNLNEVGLGCDFSLTYYSTYQLYLNELLSYPITLLSESDAIEWSKKDEVKQMKSFPDVNSSKIIDDVMVVKLSD